MPPPLTESTTMQVSWTAPADTGGTPVTDYRVPYRVVGAPSWSIAVRPVSSDTTSMITGLVGGTTYETRVAAVTTSGLVDTWSDKSGRGRHTTGTGAARPALSANTMKGRRSVVFRRQRRPPALRRILHGGH